MATTHSEEFASGRKIVMKTLLPEMVGLNALQGILFSLSSVMWTKFIHCGLGST